MRLIPFAADHLDQLEAQPGQAVDAALFTPEIGAALVNDMARTLVADGRVLACAGIQPMWPGRAVAWAILSSQIGARGFLRYHRWVARALDDAHARGLWRIETTVDPEFDNAVRWAAALGFLYEGRMRGYAPDGRDHLLVARVSMHARGRARTEPKLENRMELRT